MSRHPSGDLRPWTLLYTSILDLEKPEEFIYDPEITNSWYWKNTGNDLGYNVGTYPTKE